MIPAARRTHFHEVHGEFDSFGGYLRDFCFAPCAACSAFQGISVHPPGQPHFLVADWARLVHVDAVVLRRSTKEKIGIAYLFAPELPRTKFTQMLRALPFIGDLIAVGHGWLCLCRLCLRRGIHAGQCSAGDANNLGPD